MNTAKITALGLLERDVNEDVMCVWSYPAVSKEHGEVLVKRCGLEDKKIAEVFRWSKLGNTWQYMLTTSIDDLKYPRVKAACLVVLSEVFNPEMFNSLLKVLVSEYKAALTPTPLIKAYLKLFRSSSYGGWADKKFDNRRALIAGSIKSVVKTFGQQIALLWTAVVLKKRIFVYADSLSEVLSLVRTMPLFGSWHRNNWGILRPLVCLGEEELKDLTNAKVYVAGTLDERASSKAQYFDLFVDATSAKITVPSHAKVGMGMTAFHKDFAVNVMKAAESESEQGVIKIVAFKTKALIDSVKKIKNELQVDSLKLSDLAKHEKLSEATARFFFDVAISEGLAG
eukprot:jgi/Bigna1/81718/fgenesh1_pg.83_\